MQGCHPRRFGGFLQIFVAFQADRDPDLGFGWCSSGRSVLPHHRPGDAKHMPAAAHWHALSQSDFRRHSQRQFNFAAFSQGYVGEQKNAARAQVLGESHAFNGSSTLADGNRKQVRESLSDTAFNSNWRSGHSAVTSLPRRRKLQEDTLAYAGRQEKLQVSNGIDRFPNWSFPCTWRRAAGLLLSRK